MTPGEARAHSEGEAIGEDTVRTRVAEEIERLDERIRAALIAEGWPATDAAAVAYIVLPVIRETIGVV